MKPSEIDRAIINLCVSMRDGSIYDVNEKIVMKLQGLHKKWTDDGDIFALLEANYLVDYYCTHITNYCDSNNVYDPSRRKSASAIHKTTRQFPWEANVFTYDVFREYVQYADGFRKVKQFIIDLRKSFLQEMVPLAPSLVQPFVNRTAYDLELDWQAMLQLHPLQKYVDAAAKAIGNVTTYNAAGWGMYRLINFNNFESKAPASCITNSLLMLTLLYMCGFPPQFLVSYYQIPKNTTLKKYTHWASACRNPFNPQDTATASIVSTMDVAKLTLFWGTSAFKSYTRYILFFYKRSTSNFSYAQGAVDVATRMRILKDLSTRFDNRIAM